MALTSIQRKLTRGLSVLESRGAERAGLLDREDMMIGAICDRRIFLVERFNIGADIRRLPTLLRLTANHRNGCSVAKRLLTQQISPDSWQFLPCQRQAQRAEPVDPSPASSEYRSWASARGIIYWNIRVPKT